MKLVFFLLILTGLDLFSSAYSQDIDVTLKMRNKAVKEVLKEIESRTDYRFFYNEALIDVNRKVSIDYSETEVAVILKDLFGSYGVSYEQEGDLIVLSNRESLASEAGQELKRITGTVRDKSGETIPGVSVVIKGTTTGTTSGADGHFVLDGVSEDDIIVFSFIGMLPRELPAKDISLFDVVLEADIIGLEEVVVIGYGTVMKKDLTGSIVSLNTRELGNQNVASIGEAIQGRAAGVQIISSGEPGSNVTFRVRGTGTIGNNDPLVVVDGVPLSGGLNQVNMNDIETVQVLKDASATAIYGSRGANGVVILTTRRGNSGMKGISFDYSVGMQQATSMIELLNASEFAQLHNEILINGGLAPNPEFADPQSLGEGTNWLDEMFRVAPMQNYSLSYSGGTDKTSTYVSASVLNQEGIVINTGFKRYLMQFNSDTEISPRLKFGNSLKLEHDVKYKGDYNVRDAMLAMPDQPVRRDDDTFSGTILQPLYDGDILNPVGRASMVEMSTKGYNAHGSVFAEYEIIDGLTFKSNAGLEANLWYGRTWSPKYIWDAQTQENSYLGQTANRSFTWVWDNTLTYNRVFAEKHRINAVAGTSAQENRFDFMQGSIQKFASDNTQQLSNGTIQPEIDGNASEWALMSYIGRLNYVYDDKYYVTATVRRDGSSRFGADNKWGTFPSASVAWRISKEDFFNKESLINDLKIRAGYGQTGNQEIGEYGFASVLQTVKYNFNGNYVSSVVPSIMPNPDIHWESQEQVNAGFDMALLGGRVNVTADAYIKNTNAMLVEADIPITSGYSDVYVPDINAGKIQNKGVEVTVSSRNIDRVLTWDTDLSLSFNNNTVININDTVPQPVGSIGLNYNLALLEAGQPVNVFYGFVTNGLFQDDEEVANSAVQVPGSDPYNRTSAGDIRFRDLNNDGVINDDDRTYLGDPNPPFIFSLNNRLAYRGFDLSVFLQGVYGNEIFNANRLFSEAMAVSHNQTKETLYRWTGPGTSNTMPRAVYNDPNNNTRASNRYIEDGSYLRVKNVTLGYNFPVALAGKLRLNTARVYISAQNLLTLTNYSGFDPEVNVSGIDNNLYPLTRTISFGIKAGF